MLYKRRECGYCRIKYYRNGQPVREGAGTEKEAQARRILRERLDDLAVGWHVLPYADRVRFEELAEGFLTDYRVNGKRPLDRAEGGVEHLKGYLADWKAINITTPAGAVAGTIGIGGSRERPATPRPHHRTYGSVSGGSEG